MRQPQQALLSLAPDCKDFFLEQYRGVTKENQSVKGVGAPVATGSVEPGPDRSEFCA